MVAPTRGMVLSGRFYFRWGMQTEGIFASGTGRLELRVGMFSRGAGVLCRGVLGRGVLGRGVG